MSHNVEMLSDCGQHPSRAPLMQGERGRGNNQGLHPHGRRKGGFTLIELMISVAIVGILAAIAYPSYIQYVRRAHRADAKTALLNDAQFLERVFTESNAYNKNAAGVAITDASLPHQQSPATGTAIYTISATTLTATAYTLTATPVVGGPMAADVCGALTFNHLGQKGVGGSTVAECWGK